MIAPRTRRAAVEEVAVVAGLDPDPALLTKEEDLALALLPVAVDPAAGIDPDPDLLSALVLARLLLERTTTKEADPAAALDRTAVKREVAKSLFLFIEYNSIV